jgi:hypothetical protein
VAAQACVRQCARAFGLSGPSLPPWAAEGARLPEAAGPTPLDARASLPSVAMGWYEDAAVASHPVSAAAGGELPQRQIVKPASLVCRAVATVAAG